MILWAVCLVAMPLTEWQYRYDSEREWHPLTLPANLPRGDDAVVWLRTALPEHAFKDPVLAFDSVAPPFVATVSDVEVHRSPQEGLDAHFPPGMRWQLIGLPPDAKQLTLQVRADGQTAVVRGTPVLDERAAIVTAALERDVPRMVAGCLAALLGVLGLLATLRRRSWRLSVGYALSTIPLGLYLVHYTHLRDVLLQGPRFWFVAWLLIVPLQPLGTLLFINELLDSRWLRGLLRAHAWAAAVVLATDAVGLLLYAYGPPRTAVALFTVSMVGIRVLIAFSMLAAWWIVGRTARAGDPEARVLFLGLTAYFGSITFDLAAALGVAALAWKSQLYLGTVALALAFGFILSRRYNQAHERVATSAKEKERLLRDLHDGVGTLTSNMRMLAQLGQRGGDRAQAALASIAELSDKALSELRSFVQALDDEEMTWQLLGAELRRYSAQLVEGRGATLTMTVDVQLQGRPPGLLTLNLLRIFREALTNALKQRDVQQVTVILSALPQSLSLVVENDGVERDAHGIDLQRGVSNMKVRAEEVGGTLSLTLGAVASLRLHVPLPMRSPTDASRT